MDDEHKAQAKEQVRAFLDELGVDKAQMDSFVSNLEAIEIKAEQWSRVKRVFIDTTVRTLAYALVAGVGWAVIHFIQSVKAG